MSAKAYYVSHRFCVVRGAAVILPYIEILSLNPSLAIPARVQLPDAATWQLNPLRGSDLGCGANNIRLERTPGAVRMTFHGQRVAENTIIYCTKHRSDANVCRRGEEIKASALGQRRTAFCSEKRSSYC